MEGNKIKDELVQTLTRGRNSAKKLQNLLTQKLVNDQDVLVSVDHIATEITQSFYGGLLLLNSFNSCTLLGRAPVSPRPSLPCSSCDKTKKHYTGKTPAEKGRRGCYKRRVTSDSRMEFSSTTEDGYTWRKYGQKDILNSKTPRCYFRCTHKHVHGCKAVKQVQKLEGESNMYHIIYFGSHTCPPSTPNSTTSHPGNHDFDCKRSKKNRCSPSNPKTIADYHIDPDSTNSSASDDAQSPPSLAWKEIFRTEFEYIKNDGCFSDISFDDFFP